MLNLEKGLSANWANAVTLLTEKELARVNRYLTRRHHPARYRVFNQGDIGASFYIIVSGRIRMIHTTERGAEFTTGVWADDYIIGLISSYLGVKRSLTAESLDPVELLELRQAAMLELIETIPQFAKNISRILAVQAYDSMRRSGLAVLEPAAINLRRIMTRLSQKTNSNPEDYSRVISGLTQEDLASMVGVSRPWLNQTLSSLERSGLIQRTRISIIILDIRIFSTPPDH